MCRPTSRLFCLKLMKSIMKTIEFLSFSLNMNTRDQLKMSLVCHTIIKNISSIKMIAIEIVFIRLGNGRKTRVSYCILLGENDNSFEYLFMMHLNLLRICLFYCLNLFYNTFWNICFALGHGHSLFLEVVVALKRAV